MSYPYRNPNLQFDIPQPDPESRLLLNRETGRYLRLGLREFNWLKNLNGQIHIINLADKFEVDSELMHEFLQRLKLTKLIYFSNEPIEQIALEQGGLKKVVTNRIEWIQFGQLRIHFGEAKSILNYLSNITKKLFELPLIIIGFSIIVIGLLLGVAQWPMFINEIQTFYWNTERIVFVFLLFFITTLIHELGHAVACDYFGAPVRSIGIMIYYLQPAAYVDISDSWQLANRWDRVIISFAGIYIQSILTGITMIFWTTLRWTGHSKSLLAVFAGMNAVTVLFNLNPFVKLDGYWIISNAIGVPNLRDRAIEWSMTLVKKIFTRAPIEAKNLQYNAVLSMPPLGRALLAYFGFSSLLFGVSMWIGGIGFLLRITHWLSLSNTTSYITILIIILILIALFVKRKITTYRARKQPDSDAKSKDKINKFPASVRLSIDPQRPIKLNPHISVIENNNTTITFGWPSPDALMLKDGGRLFNALPSLRDGSITIQQLKKLNLWDSKIETAIEQLWQHKHLRYTSDWSVHEHNLRYSRQLGWLSMNPATRAMEAESLSNLQQSTVTILGMGGLGTHVAWNLAACGIGEIHLVDGDIIEMTNLNRQLFYTPNDINQFKVDVAAERLHLFNPAIRIKKTNRFMRNCKDIEEVIRGSNFVVRALDTPPDTLMWVNEACVNAGIPYSGAGFLPYGTFIGPTVIPGASACLGCIRESHIPRIDRGKGASIAPLVYATAGILAFEVVTHLAKMGTLQTVGRILELNALPLNFSFRDIQMKTTCQICGRQEARSSV